MSRRIDEETEYWTLVHSDRGDLNGRAIRPIDMPYQLGGMLVFTTNMQAMLAVEEIHRLYGIVCRPVLLGQESR